MKIENTNIKASICNVAKDHVKGNEASMYQTHFVKWVIVAKTQHKS